MKRILFIIFIVISFLIIYNFSSSIYRLLSKKDVLIQAQSELKKAQNENTNLKKQLMHVKNPEFMEEQARDKLFLVKPGENSVVIPQGLLPTPIITKTSSVSKQNWQKWLEIFAH
ncbi:MAG TPA: septum formation initiator family protein [Candidatus Saccharimonadales bacterium]|nr:septum formation initiator family protein [Candidatus Saccharimonadales bacterium]